MRVSSAARIFGCAIGHVHFSFARPKEKQNQRERPPAASPRLKNGGKFLKRPNALRFAPVERGRFFTEFSTIFLHASPKRPELYRTRICSSIRFPPQSDFHLNPISTSIRFPPQSDFHFNPIFTSIRFSLKLDISEFSLNNFFFPHIFPNFTKKLLHILNHFLR
jgi:hypothetical protein